MTLMMKKIFNFLIIGALLLMASCQKPEHVLPTADRQGITSITAIFTWGPNQDEEMVKYLISDDKADEYIVPIPWYFPEETTDETTVYMSKIRLTAELEPNCILEPSIGSQIWDFSKGQKYEFTFTNAQGESRKIFIGAERTKSNKCDVLSFSTVTPAVSGVIDNVAGTILLPSLESIPASAAKVELSPHATISPDPATVRSYDETVEYTVTAHDGTTKKFTVEITIPDKLDRGIDKTSAKQLFNLDPMKLGLPQYDVTGLYPSLAYIEKSLVVSLGNGTPLLQLNGLSGAKIGDIDFGFAPYAITSDEAGNMLLCNQAAKGETLYIYKTNSLSKTPEMFHSFVNETEFTTSYKLKVIGDVDGDALITLAHFGSWDAEGNAVTSGTFTLVTIKEGQVISTEFLDMKEGGIAWKDGFSIATVVAASTSKADGFYESSYSDNTLSWIRPDMTVGQALPTQDGGNAWARNPNMLDSKSFNNCRYMVLLDGPHFPGWGGYPGLYVYDITDPSEMKGNYETASKLVLSNTAIDRANDVSVTSVSTGDVIIGQSEDGFNMYVYYYDQFAGAIGGYSADCIKR